MAISKDPIKLGLEEEQKKVLDQLWEQPQDEALQANLVLVSKRLDSFKKSLFRCASYFHASPENEGYIDLYKLVLENAALNGQHDLIETHWKAFKEAFEVPEITHEELNDTFQKLLATEDNHPAPEGP